MLWLFAALLVLLILLPLSAFESTAPLTEAGRHFLASPSPELLAGVLAGGGSVVLVRGDMEAADLARLLEQESAQPR